MKKSKSAAIREALKTESSPSAVAASLKKQGYKVTPQYVSTIKANDLRKSKSTGPRRKPGRPPINGSKSPSTFADTAAAIQQAIELVLKTGSVQDAKALCDQAGTIVAKLQG